MKAVKCKVWVITYHLMDLADEHQYYGDLINECEISKESEEVEFYV